jgi:hypothetical protein
MSAYKTITDRIPSNMPPGKSKIVGATLVIGTDLAEAIATIARRDDLTPKGRANLMRVHIKNTAGPAFEKSKRQFEWHQRAIDTRKATIKKKALGEVTPNDAEYRAVLRTMPLPERTQAILTNLEFRGAALRGGAALAGIPGDVYQNAFDAAVAENAAEESAALEKAEAEQAVHGAALGVVQGEMMRVPAIDDPNSGARPFHNAKELGDFLAREVPAAPVHLQQREQIEADEAAA